MCVLVTQLCMPPCDRMDCSPLGSSVHGILQAEYWIGLSFPPSGDLPNRGIELGSPALHCTHSSEPPGKPLIDPIYPSNSTLRYISKRNENTQDK